MSVETRRAQRRARFIEAAIEVFGSEGYANSSVEAICAATKLSRRQFYESFDQREDLLVAAYDLIQAEAEQAVLKRVASLTPPFDPQAAIAELFAVYLGAVGSSPPRVRIAYVEIIGVSQRVEEHRRARRATWVPLIEEIARSVHGPQVRLPGGPGMTATALIGAINALAHEWSLTDPRPPLDELVEVLRVLVAGIGIGCAESTG